MLITVKHWSECNDKSVVIQRKIVKINIVHSGWRKFCAILLQARKACRRCRYFTELTARAEDG